MGADAAANVVGADAGGVAGADAAAANSAAVGGSGFSDAASGVTSISSDGTAEFVG
ncbi:MAG: hypothetical protein WD176_09065 [Pirellulales bacterium]